MLHKRPWLGRAIGALLVIAYCGGLFLFSASFLKASDISRLFGIGGFSFGGSSSSYVPKVVVSNDGGQSWKTVYTSQSSQYMRELTCPTATACFAYKVIYNDDTSSLQMLATQDAGQHWLERTLTVEPQAPNYEDEEDEYDVLSSTQLVCPSATRCYALSRGVKGDALSATSNGGDSWKLVNSQVAKWELSSLACPTEPSCFAVGTDGLIMHTDDSGQTWQTYDSPTSNNLYRVACTSSTSCLALGRSGIVVATEDGQKWSKLAAAPYRDLSQLACSSDQTCYAYTKYTSGGHLVLSKDNGTSWEKVSLGNDKTYLSSLSCSSGEVCAGVQNGEMRSTSDGGNSWRTASQPDNQRLMSLSCPTKTTCYAITGPEIR